MSESGVTWSVGLALQAKADWDARAALCRDSALPQCQQLHFLQMACEKLCKAYLCRHGSIPEDIQSSHAYVAKTLPRIVVNRLTADRHRRPRDTDRLMREIRLLAREIELLAPAVKDDGRRPDNCEYPWRDASERIRIPAQHGFPNVGLLNQPSGWTLLKIVTTEIDGLCSDLA